MISQNVSALDTSVKSKRRIFRFNSGLWVEVFWHGGRGTWVAEADMGTRVKRGRNSENFTTSVDHRHLGTTLDGARDFRLASAAVRYLRVVIAEKKNPKLRNVRLALTPPKDRPDNLTLEAIKKLEKEYGI